MTTICDLDEHTLARIVELAGGPYFVTGLRGSSRELRTRIVAPAHCFSDTLLREAALAGDLQLCALARHRGAIDVETMLCAGATGGHIEVCILAKEWGASCLRYAEQLASMNGHAEAVRLINTWIGSSLCDIIQHGLNVNFMLVSSGSMGCLRFSS
jgi:hypothetical protein